MSQLYRGVPYFKCQEVRVSTVSRMTTLTDTQKYKGYNRKAGKVWIFRRPSKWRIAIIKMKSTKQDQYKNYHI